MFSIFTRKNPTFKDALGFIGSDMHNHILPGIDDGSPDTETSMILTDGLFDLGYKNIICTPHILSDLHPNTPATISESFENLLPIYAEKYKPESIGYAAEYMVDYDFEVIVQNGNLLTFGKEKYILIEMSYLVESPNLKNMIFNLLTTGYQPILAHPERYSFFHHKISIYEDLLDAGCDLQVNLLSLSGHYGGKVKSIAEKLIENGWINWLGTDMHHVNHLESLRQLARNKSILKKLSKIKGLKNQGL